MDEAKRAPVRRIVEARIETTPQLGTLIQDALSVYQTEILKFKNKVNKGVSLTLPEARVLQGYVKSLVDAAREIREREDDSKEVALSDEELLEQTKLGVAALEARVAAKKKMGGQSGPE